MKLGVLLPTFVADSAPALAAAAAAREAGLDGVFAFDHLWPMGEPTRPALAPFPVLAAVAARHPTLVVGPLVARVGLFGTEHLVGELATLEALAPGRVVAALGTGDRQSVAEEDAYGLARRTADERRALLGEAAARLAPLMPVWIGAGQAQTNALARELGVTLNLWGAAPEAVAEESERGPVSWAGPLRGDPRAALGALERAGATWVVATHAGFEALANWRRENPLTTFH